MNLEYYPLDKLTRTILNIAGKYLDLHVYQIFFFGSRVTGKNSPRADVDVGINGPKEIPFTILGKIWDEIEELPILYKIDIVDFQKVTKEFKKIALQKTLPLKEICPS